MTDSELEARALDGPCQPFGAREVRQGALGPVQQRIEPAPLALRSALLAPLQMRVQQPADLGSAAPANQARAGRGEEER
jgi:hypothetical protein